MIGVGGEADIRDMIKLQILTIHRNELIVSIISIITYMLVCV